MPNQHLLAQMADVKAKLAELADNIDRAEKLATPPNNLDAQQLKTLSTQLRFWMHEETALAFKLTTLEREFLNAEFAAYLAGDDAEFSAIDTSGISGIGA